jgi:uncharacterized protein
MAHDTTLLDVAPVRSRDEVVARLRAHEAEIRGLGASALYVFGSAARDELTPESDVDVFIDYAPGSDFSLVEWVRLDEYLPQLLGRKVDFTTRGGLHRRMRDEVEREALRVF